MSEAKVVTARQVEEWRVAAEKGDVAAQYLLGHAFYFGKGVKKDLEQAVLVAQICRERQRHRPEQSWHVLLAWRRRGERREASGSPVSQISRARQCDGSVQSWDLLPGR